MWKSRGLIRIIAEGCAACELAKNPNYVKIFWDETQRRAVPLTAFAAAMMNDNGVRLIVLPCLDVGIGGKLTDLVNTVLCTLEKGR